jgi:hypothetical protein
MSFNDIFTVLKKGPLPSDEEIEKIPSFMFCIYLGGNQVTIKAANEFNKYYKEIPMHLQYKMTKQVFAGKGLYATLPKKTPDENHLDNLCEHYKISRCKAKEYREFLSDEEFAYINMIYESKKG